MSRRPVLAPNDSPSSTSATNKSTIAKAYACWRLPARAGPLQGSIGSAEDALHDGVVKWVAADPALASTDEQGAYLRKTV